MRRLTHTHHIQVQNVEQVLERGEKLELLVDKTEGLQHQVCVGWVEGMTDRRH
jgi:hypothetical protein